MYNNLLLKYQNKAFTVSLEAATESVIKYKAFCTIFTEKHLCWSLLLIFLFWRTSANSCICIIVIHMQVLGSWLDSWTKMKWELNEFIRFNKDILAPPTYVLQSTCCQSTLEIVFEITWCTFGSRNGLNQFTYPIKCYCCPHIGNSQIDLLCKSIDWFLYEGNTGT